MLLSYARIVHSNIVCQKCSINFIHYLYHCLFGFVKLYSLQGQTYHLVKIPSSQLSYKVVNIVHQWLAYMTMLYFKQHNSMVKKCHILRNLNGVYLSLQRRTISLYWLRSTLAWMLFRRLEKKNPQKCKKEFMIITISTKKSISPKQYVVSLINRWSSIKECTIKFCTIVA